MGGLEDKELADAKVGQDGVISPIDKVYSSSSSYISYF